jgi:hypothetical protein
VAFLTDLIEKGATIQYWCLGYFVWQHRWKTSQVRKKPFLICYHIWTFMI